jgi:hypothetical protein
VIKKRKKRVLKDGKTDNVKKNGKRIRNKGGVMKWYEKSKKERRNKI